MSQVARFSRLSHPALPTRLTGQEPGRRTERERERETEQERERKGGPTRILNTLVASSVLSFKAKRPPDPDPPCKFPTN